MRIAGIVRDSIVDGDGIRDVVFVQGCPHHCPGCHNAQTWDYNGGRVMSVDEILSELSNSSNDLTISGGEPLIQPMTLELVRTAYDRYHKSSWLYTGFTFEDVPMSLWFDLWTSGVTVVVEGRFDKDLKDPNLVFRGSSNQRVIDLEKTLRNDHIVLWEGIE